MIEKLAVSIAAVLAIVLGIWARVNFVRRSEIYSRNGQPIYQHTVNCKELQQNCNKMICLKIEEVKTAQRDAEQKRDDARQGIQTQLAAIQQFIGRVEQYMKDH